MATTTLDWLERLRALRSDHPPPALPPFGSLRLSEFATSGRVVHLWSEVVGAEVYFAADNADISAVPPDAVIFGPDELAHITAAGPKYLRLLWETKAAFDPHQRTEDETGSGIEIG